jgi:hypothetical protein
MIRKPTHTAPRRGGLRRKATASMEAVIATGLTFPFAVFMLIVGIASLRRLWHVVASLVGWPYL